MLGIKNRRRRQRTCQDLVCLFDSKCEIVHNQPHCTCRDVFCTIEEEQQMNVCASDGRTYRSKCEIKRQQCMKQYEIVLMYPGVCNGSLFSFAIDLVCFDFFLSIRY